MTAFDAMCSCALRAGAARTLALEHFAKSVISPAGGVAAVLAAGTQGDVKILR